MIETKELIPISDMSISEISDDELETAFLAVAIQHKDAIKSIHQSMVDADNVWQKYTDENYEPLEDVAKKDRAFLNKADSNIAEQFKTLKTAYEKPLETVEMNIRSIRNAIKDRSGMVDKAVKTFEEKQRAKKLYEIRAYFNDKKFNLVPLERFFDGRWLNKTCKMADIKKEIDDFISTVYGNIKILENIAAYGVIAKSSYLETLDMGAAMRQVETLKANAERLAREKIEREQRELKEQVERNAAEQRREVKIIQKEERIKSLVDEAMDVPEPETRSEILEYTLKFRGTKEQLLKLKQYMTNIGIAYEKVG